MFRVIIIHTHAKRSLLLLYIIRLIFDNLFPQILIMFLNFSVKDYQTKMSRSTSPKFIFYFWAINIHKMSYIHNND